MRLILATLCGAALLAGLQAQASSHTGRRAPGATAYTPAQGMLSTLNSMSFNLNQVDSRQKADAAAPALLELHQQYLQQRETAENMPDMPQRALDQHLARLDTAMNSFRLACARLLREKCYGSTRLGGAIKHIVQDF